MLYVENDVIHLNRGDDAELKVSMETYDGDGYVLDDDEYLIFGVREKPIASSDLLLEIAAEPGEYYIPFKHEDTADLPVGFYSAEIQLMSGGQRMTIWPKLTGSKRTSTDNRRNFCLMTEVITK